jgi:orotate phosphoribosyltransferase-like protein
MSKINRITNVFTKTISKLIKEGDKLKEEAMVAGKQANKLMVEAETARNEAKRAYKIAGKLEGVLN